MQGTPTFKKRNGAERAAKCERSEVELAGVQGPPPSKSATEWSERRQRELNGGATRGVGDPAIKRGSEWGPVALPVFKTGRRLR